MGVNVWNVKVGDKVREQGKDYDLTVHHIDPPTSGGRAMRYGPTIYAWIGPGRYGTTFDAETSHRFDKVGPWHHLSARLALAAAKGVRALHESAITAAAVCSRQRLLPRLGQ